MSDPADREAEEAGPESAGSGTAGAGGGELAPAVRSLVALSAALASRDEGALRGGLEEARRAASPQEVEEALLQSCLFLGYPAALNAMAAWRDLTGREPPGPASRDPEAWRARGERVCRIVYGDQYRSLRDNVRALHPDLEEWMLSEGYGKVLGRPGLDLRVRELCVVGLLAVLATPVQLHSHLRGALNAGATSRQVDEALEAASGYMDEGARRTARATWSRVRRGAGSG